MKKLKMQLITKIIICSVLILISTILFIVQFKESKNYKTAESETKLYNYNVSSDIKYNVKLFDNSIYDKKILPQDGFYISSIVDDIELSFTNKFSGSEISKIFGKYNITATVKGNISEQNEIKMLWSKFFILKNDTEFSNLSSKKQIVENLILDYDWFNNLSKEIYESTKILTSNFIELVMNIEYNVETKHGIVKEIINPTIIIPIGSNYFSTISSNLNEKTGDIKKIDKIIIDPNFTLIISCRIIIAILLLAIIALFIFTTNPSEYDMYIKKINKIFKNYSKLLVGINNSTNLDCDNIFNVNSFDDLIKISDEIEKPIFYNFSENIGNMNKFYIINENTSYIYYVRHSLAIISSNNLEDSKGI